MIDRRWLPLNALRAFEAAGRQLSFTAAASALGVSQSAISRHVISLEALLGVPLFERRPQQLALTEAGTALLPVVRKSFDRMEQALNEVVPDGGGSRTLRMLMPPTFAHRLAVPLLRDLRRECPDVILDIAAPAQPASAKRDADLVVEHARPQVSDDVSDLLWMVQLTPLCHPAVAQRQAGHALGEFLAANELLHVRLEGVPRQHLWELFARRFGLAIDTDRGLAFDTAMLAAEYALSGEGVALLDSRMFAAEIADGRLVAPYAAVLDDGYGYYLNIRPEDLTDPAIALVRSWMIRRFAEPAADGQAPRPTPHVRLRTV